MDSLKIDEQNQNQHVITQDLSIQEPSKQIESILINAKDNQNNSLEMKQIEQIQIEQNPHDTMKFGQEGQTLDSIECALKQINVISLPTHPKNNQTEGIELKRIKIFCKLVVNYKKDINILNTIKENNNK